MSYGCVIRRVIARWMMSSGVPLKCHFGNSLNVSNVTVLKVVTPLGDDECLCTRIKPVSRIPALKIDMHYV